MMRLLTATLCIAALLALGACGRNATTRAASSRKAVSSFTPFLVTIRRNSETVTRPSGVVREQVRALVNPDSGEVCW